MNIRCGCFCLSFVPVEPLDERRCFCNQLVQEKCLGVFLDLTELNGNQKERMETVLFPILGGHLSRPDLELFSAAFKEIATGRSIDLFLKDFCQHFEY